MTTASKLTNIIIRAYQVFISPWLGNRCRFYPSCSCYSQSCFEQYSYFTALRLTVLRLLKCHPLHPGGVDLP